jgi:glyoxylase-like metal-dependent hydrolase (beta-lactamase superfamily II)
MVVYGTVDGKKCLFTGDAVFACGQVLIQSLPDVSLFPYAQAMKKLAEFEVDALFPGHGVFCLENGGSHVRAAAEKFACGLIPPQLYYFT